MPDKPLCLLDNIRLGNGNDSLKNYFGDLLKNNREKAQELINNPDLKYGSLYHLRHECSLPFMADVLSPLFRKVLQITETLLEKTDRYSELNMRSGGDETCAALKWMIKTGFGEEDNGSGYDQVMEHSAALLVKSFHDVELLPEIVEMIYKRNKTGRLIHELAWAFFEARRPESLGLLAYKLNSLDSRDTALSKKLLGFIPCIAEQAAVSGSTLYGRAMKWLQGNLPFLYYTGESLHMSSQPIHYAIAWDAKYLCRPVSDENSELLSELNPFENELLKNFRELPESTRILLADFSYELYRTNFHQWYSWMQLPLAGQASLAERYMEVQP